MRVSGVFTPDSLFGRQGRRNALDDIGGASADAGILDGLIDTHQLQRFPPRHRISDSFICRHAGINTICHTPRRIARRGLSHIIKEIAYRHIENLTDIPQLGCADPVGATLIFLHLLKNYI